VPDAVITFLSDYGLADDFVGVCHGVIARGCPGARVIDLTHGVAPHDVSAGALALVRALPYVPSGVHLAVVDPGVGGSRRGIAARCADGRCLVGPDNGLLWPAAQWAGGVAALVDLAGSPVALAPVSATFHGRDVFAPVAAALAAGTLVERVGEPVDPASLVAVKPWRAHVCGDAVVARVVAVDRFGNLELDAGADDLAAAGLDGATEIMIGAAIARVGMTFADVADGELLLYVDAHDALALAVNRGDAARHLCVGVGAELRIVAP
jgi:hypothetical protein